MNNLAQIAIGASGSFDMHVLHADGTKDIYPNCKNKILNQGLNVLGNDYPANYGSSNYFFGGVAVGTGNTPPTATDTQLQAGLAIFTGGFGGPASTYNATAPYASSNEISFTFAVGAVVGNIAEVGLVLKRTSGSYTVNDALFSRALIMVGGSPGTITLLATDQLVVYYTLTFTYAADTSGSLTVTTDGTPASVGYTVRPGALDYGNSFAIDQPFAPLHWYNTSSSISASATTNVGFVAANGVPSLTGSVNTQAVGAYTPGSYTLSMTCHWNSGVTINEIMWWMRTNLMGFQILFASNVVKTNLQTMDWGCQITWAAT